MTIEEIGSRRTGASAATGGRRRAAGRLGRAADELVADLVARPWGRSSASVYETGRLVALAPWLTGHAKRLRFLLAGQRADGGWGPPHPGYALVPTLSAAEALLSALCGGRPWPDGVGRAETARAAGRALDALASVLDGGLRDVPDMPAVEHITPALIESINGHLDRLPPDVPPGLARWAGRRLAPPAGMDGAFLAALRSHLVDGGNVPTKLLHALEIAGPAARRARSVVPEPLDGPGAANLADGAGAPPFAMVGASAAATAAWLGPDEPGTTGEEGAVRRYLEAAVAEHDGPVQVAVPVTNFERGWVLGWLARAGLAPEAPAGLLAELRASLGEHGAPGGTGLPPDADSSSGVLYALAVLGAPHPPDLLWEYETETHFSSWPGENGRSVTTNAHVLEAFGQYRASTGSDPSGRYSATIRKVASWLVEQQFADGRWEDRWHASPLYATACTAMALDAFGGPESSGAVARAVRWTIGAQRPDGSWGRWGGSAEETAYALQILALVRTDGAGTLQDAPGGAGGVAGAVARGAAYLRTATGAWWNETGDGFAEAPSGLPTLWHDKDLYNPITIVRAAVVGALHLAGDGRAASAG
ncbi:serine/threonine-protein kinase [Actinomadura sediminis]|uniref:Squalene cyclase C-terminal domain-containing protein n=1 Tax=Actinomadura sediminis TaxID=1038904 RepID=A0ABW3EUM9_9ACTN